MKSSPPQQDAMAETWTADLLVLGQALYHWATLFTSECNRMNQQVSCTCQRLYTDYDLKKTKNNKCARIQNGDFRANCYTYTNYTSVVGPPLQFICQPII